MRDKSEYVLFRDGNHIEPPDESYWDTEGTSDNPYVPNPAAQIEGLPVSCLSPSTAWRGEGQGRRGGRGQTIGGSWVEGVRG